LSRWRRTRARAKDAVADLATFALIARLDQRAARSWMRAVPGVRASMGDEACEHFSDLVLKLAAKDARAARIAAWAAPDNAARVHPTRRSEFFALLGEVAHTRPRALALVARTLPDLMEQLEGPALGRFLKSGIELHADGEHLAESFLKRESEKGRKELARLTRGLALNDVKRSLALYARAHCGEDVQVRPGMGKAFSEGRHIYLPERMDRYGDDRDFTVYRVLTARLAGHLEFGTFDLDLRRVPGPWPQRVAGETELERLFRSFPNRVLARDLFQVGEELRVERRIRGTYPGLAKDLNTLRADELDARPAIEGMAPAEVLLEALKRLALDGESPELAQDIQDAVDACWPLLEVATVNQLAEHLPALYAQADALLKKVGEDDLKPRPTYESHDPESGLRPEQMGAEEREQEEQARELQEELEAQGLEATLSQIRKALKEQAPIEEDELSQYEEMVELLEKMQAPDGGEVDEGEDVDHGEPGDADGEQLDSGTDSVLYPEWDTTLEDYKPGWVRVKETVLEPGDSDFVQEVLERRGREIRTLRRRFQALRPEELRRVRGLVDGDALDLDRVIQARVERRAGSTPTDRIYARTLRDRRDVAVAFLLDMSSSTNEVAGEANRRIIEIEKEALVLIAEAVDALGDACAIWGFSGYGRDHVAFYVAKSFKDPYDGSVRDRIGQMDWKMENRDGAAIRHATELLRRQPARTRLLILLSDGRPLDCGCDHYYDRYAQEDTRVALSEARKTGVHPFCITVDPRARSYLEELYGEVGYIVIDDAEALPAKLPRIYRRLTR
jgi:nitric oxide reductase NorD protein